MFYAALDVSLRSVAICIIDQDGKVRLERSVPSEVPDLVRCLRDFGEPIHQLGLEAGTLTQHLTYGLTEAGLEVICMEARQVNAALSAMRNKTDKHDARGIAQILRSGWYSRVHVKSVDSHHLRALLTCRKVMQRKCIDLENEIRGLLKIFGVKLPLRLSRGAFDVAVRDTIESDPALSHAMLPMLQARRVLFDTFTELDRRVRKAAHADPVCQRFMGVPGVGEISALSFKAAVDDPARFKSSRTVGAHFGLTPRRFQSGEKDMVHHKGAAEGFRCTAVDMRRNQRAGELTPAMRWEVEANEFSSLLLMPPPIWRQEMTRFRLPDIGQVTQMAKRFGVSKEAAARTFASYHEQPIAMVVVKDGKFERAYRNFSTFPKLCVSRGMPIPAGSIFHRAKHVAGQATDIVEARAEAWLESDWGKPMPDLSEQVQFQAGGYALIMLWAEVQGQDEEFDPDENLTAKQRLADRISRLGR